MTEQVTRKYATFHGENQVSVIRFWAFYVLLSSFFTILMLMLLKYEISCIKKEITGMFAMHRDGMI